ARPRPGGAPRYGIASGGKSEPRAFQPGALGIPGVSKGFVPSAARAGSPAQLFAVGDRVRHRMFGEGTVTELKGDGREARLVIQFDGRGEKIFPADTAPIIKI
ncbi:MAG: hypothetical protein VB065_09315, partial [Eubacteriales bacterium]|nr:hypothetical protein [Eubacteriales bacterium]